MATKPVEGIDAELFWTLANSQEDRAVLMERAAKHENLKEHPAVKEHVEFQSRVNSQLGDWKGKVEALEKELGEIRKKDTWKSQEESLRKAPYNFNDSKIAAFKKRIEEDPDRPGFPEMDSKGRTYYQRLAQYYADQDTPIGASTTSISNLPYGLGEKSDSQPWRKAIEENPKLIHNRKERRKMNRENWETAIKEQQEAMGS